MISTFDAGIAELKADLAGRFDSHDDAAIIRSMPGLGTILGARLLAELGDDPERYSSARARRNIAHHPRFGQVESGSRPNRSQPSTRRRL